MKLKSIIY